MWRRRKQRRFNANRLRGCMLGGALADAMAFAHEGRGAGPVPPLRVGSISDDTQLTLATCESLIAAKGTASPESVAEHFVQWHRQRGFCGIGAATAKALQELRVGGHWALVGRKGEMAAGNGAAIRIAPLAFVLDLGARKDRRTLRDISRITHHNDEAYAGGTVKRIVEAGGECDSTASIAGQCFGALQGEEGLPAEYIAQLPAFVSDITDRLLQVI